jgi:dTDP-glucose 4,6-dehydratase
MNILVTGGAGFIGSNFLEIVKKNPKYNIVGVIDKLSYAAKADRVAKLDIQLYASCIEMTKWEYLFRKHDIDAVINFAAESHVDNSIIDGCLREFIESNYMGVASLIEDIRRHKKRTSKSVYLLQVSTDEVLGDLPLDAIGGLAPSAPLHPNNPYSATKAAAEQLLEAMFHTYGDFNYTIVRATNNYGPNQHTEKFIPTIIRNALYGQSVPIYGKGENVREWLYVDDFVSGIVAVLDKYAVSSQDVTSKIFHFGSENKISNLALVETILELLGVGKDLITFVPDRLGHDRRYSLDYSATTEALGWKPSHDFVAGLQRTIAYYKHEA